MTIVQWCALVLSTLGGLLLAIGLQVAVAFPITSALDLPGLMEYLWPLSAVIGFAVPARYCPKRWRLPFAVVFVPATMALMVYPVTIALCAIAGECP